MWQFLINPLAPYFFCGIIVTIFLGTVFFYGKHEKKQIKDSIDSILISIVKFHNRKDFYEKYEAFDSQLLENAVFHNAWAEYAETVIIDPDNERIIITKRPHDYINEHSIISQRINLRLLHAVPNYLVGIGLLFTFIGLVAAIHFAAGGLSDGNGEQALKNLLQMASVKFLSSITGLFCSMILSVIQKHWLNNLNKKIFEVCRKIEELTISITIEQLLNDSFKDQKDQTNTLKHLATEIAMQISGALADKLPASVALAMQPLAEALNNTAQKLTATNHEGLEQMLNSFTSKLEGAAENEIKELVVGLKSIQESLQGLLKHIESTGETFNSKLSDAADSLGATLEKTLTSFSEKMNGAAQNEIKELAQNLMNTQESLQGLLANIQNTGDTFGSKIVGAAGELSNTLLPVSKNLVNFNDNIGAINEKMYAQLDRFDNNIGSLNATLQNIKQTADHIHQAGEPISKAAEGIKNTARSMDLAYKQIQDAFNTSQQTVSAMQRVSEKVVNVWDSYEERFKGVDQDMVKAFVSMQDGLNNFKLSTRDFVSQFDENFRSAISLLEGAINELSEEREKSVL
jgi:methyl-accepting chemotaxis protein